MLPYEEQVVSDLVDDPNGGLVVLSSGFRLQSLIAALLTLHSPASGSLLILSTHHSPLHARLPSHLRPDEIPGDLPSHHRSRLYSTGNAYFVTPRVLIADLLTGRCSPSAVAGIVIVDAHRVSETSTEAFIARILRTGNNNVSVRAFSDRPQAMVAGFSKVERVMKCLFVRRLHLWPRFQLLVSADLERDPPEVVDIRVPMTSSMRAVQTAVLGAMDACLKELRKTNKVDVEDLTVENGLFKSFDEIVRRQLDPIWHTLGKKTRQLVTDLRTLRKLADYLIRYDAVTYLKYLDTLRASEGSRSMWIFADSSQKIFEFAKRRVYHAGFSDGTKTIPNNNTVVGKKRKFTGNKKNTKIHGECANVSNKNETSGVVLEEFLEEAPKWKVLRELLEEIEQERVSQPLSRDCESVNADVDDNEIVLVACKDERSCMQLEDCIVKGPEKVMREEWEKYLLGKTELIGLTNKKKQKTKEPKGFGILDGEIPVGYGEHAITSSMNKLENDALLAVASKVIDLAKEENVVGCDTDPSIRNFNLVKGKSKVETKNVQISRNKSQTGSAGKCDLGESCNGNVDIGNKLDSKGAEELKKDLSLNVSVRVLRKHTENNGESDCNHAKQLPPVQFYATESDKDILHVMKPSVIVVYHADMAFVREIEIYKAENPSKKLRVYFLFYEDSTEVQKFEANIRKENAAFESLIRQKSLMMIPIDQDGRCTGFAAAAPEAQSPNSNSLTRKAGGRKLQEKKMQVIVDMREFNSSLPNVLHQKGMHIIPVTLEVGDYILSPSICVERKSIADLFQSFASGRLYHQVEMMSRYYKIPVLLIEFTQDKSFSFQSSSEIGDDVSRTNIVSKLSLLVLHFPRLRLVWSRSVHATAEIFSSIKTNQDEPDEIKAVRVGVPSEDGVVENDVKAENFNTTAVEFLRRLPGVTDANYRTLMDGCKSLADLALLPIEELAELMGSQKGAKTLREFLDAKCPIMF